ncbi:nickel pincer cofactor biosynthesis protein LarC [Saccharopolyspora rhizosphaerae]|uniref:Pyridinium-3,5-bisthiocarboxylic acid mononucleotide nickel insertion protein n=1 Tax=Saccharopolyspora rhizosphaerae TaxID=2492662 RepID=A0A426K350_9PSEU|nr:nickel pincer cofactor biosynthesis protein LarC [Saccharopolyspora rhizosphaerae]RRO19902.1 nickel pincer cofactor biosynthesis protein LarC [Saccharopolyspora rhizosphaerae]
MIVWLNPATGLSGDMLLGALLGLGAPLERVRAAIESTGLTGWSLSTEQVQVDGIAATRAAVAVDDDAPERHAAELIELASRAHPEPVAAMAVSALEAIARVEGALHDRDPAEVHLHEVGGLDTIVDTVGVAAALHALSVTAVHSAPITLGSGTVRCAHGELPAPAPATLRLLKGAAVVGADLAGETVTPTGAALVAAMGTRFTPPPAMTLGATAYGAGAKRFPQRPNVLSASLGSPRSESSTMVVVECTVDDVTGETLGHVVDRLLDAGAADAWTSPATMKKSRPAHVLHVLCTSAAEAALTEVVLAETGTLGVRRHEVQRTALPRHTTTVDVRGHQVRVKHGPHRSKPEHDDVAAAADALGLPLRTVAELALRAVRD